jgi:hypothetical protein
MTATVAQIVPMTVVEIIQPIIDEVTRLQLTYRQTGSLERDRFRPLVAALDTAVEHLPDDQEHAAVRGWLAECVDSAEQVVAATSANVGFLAGILGFRMGLLAEIHAALITGRPVGAVVPGPIN